MYGIVLFLVLCTLNSLNGAPTTDSMVILSNELSSQDINNNTALNTSTEKQLQKIDDGGLYSDKSIEKKIEKPELYYMKVLSEVNTRYAKTLITSRVVNPANKAQEVTFSVVIPDAAFISEFLMEIDGKVYKAEVKEKEEAKKTYDNAVQSGISAGHVAVSARDSNRFTVNVNIEPHQKAIFNLTYEELLTRRLGVYNLDVNINTDDIVRELGINVHIKELRKITVLRVPEIRTGNEIDADETSISNPLANKKISEDGLEAFITFEPNLKDQKKIIDNLKLKKSEKNKKNEYPYGNDEENENKNGLSGQFTVQYDVERDPNGGEVVVFDGYFVHFFAPKDIKPLNKHVIFVLDVSGSMYGRKIEQLKEAMLIILDELKPGDYLNLLQFSDDVKSYNLDNLEQSIVYRTKNSWYPYDQEEEIPDAKAGIKNEKIVKITPPFEANEEIIKKAKNVVQGLNSQGGTNIYDALSVALNISNTAIKYTQKRLNNTNETQVDTKLPKSLPEPIIILLTDGEATTGITSTTSMLKLAQQLNNNSNQTVVTSIFTLGFGNDADRDFLKKLSLNNHGFFRPIYEASDSARQLESFYRQISSPLLSNVSFVYPMEKVQNITKPTYTTLFNGSEVIIAGKLNDNEKELENPEEILRAFTFCGTGIDGPRVFPPNVKIFKKETPQNSLERLWAYLTIKELLEQKEAEISPERGAELFNTTPKPNEEKSNSTILKDKALNLALKYSFVTPVTSLVVVKPNQTSTAIDPEEASVLNNGVDRFAYSNVGLSGVPLSLNAFSYNSIKSHTSYATSPLMGYAGPPATFFDEPIYQTNSVQDSFSENERISNEETNIDSNFHSTTPSNSNALYPWLSDLLINENTILVNSTQYKLGDLIDVKECKSPKPDVHNAICTNFSQCTQLIETFTNSTSYLPYFCDINGYAGVCCDQINKNVTISI